MKVALQSGCAEIFKRIGKLHISRTCFGWSDERLLSTPLDMLDVDSITLLEFVMELESAYAIKLNDDDVNRCKTLLDFVTLVAATRNGSH